MLIADTDGLAEAITVVYATQPNVLKAQGHSVEDSLQRFTHHILTQ